MGLPWEPGEEVMGVAKEEPRSARDAPDVACSSVKLENFLKNKLFRMMRLSMRR